LRQNTSLRIWMAFAAVLAAAPWAFSSGLSLALLSQMGIAIIACLSFNMLLGQGGMMSFGHAMYSGLGAFCAMHALNHWSTGALALPVTLIPLVGGLGGLVCALLLGGISTGKSGTPFAMITLGLGELVYAAALMVPELFGGEGGVTGNRVAGAAVFGITYGPARQMYYLIAAYTLVCVALMYAFTQTPLGRLLNAARDNPQRLEFVGYNPQRVRYAAFVVSGFFAGVAGGLAALNFEIVNAEAVSATRSGAYLLFTVLGGTAQFYGPIIGGVLMVLATVFLSELTKAWLLYLGLAFIAMVVLAPGGIAAGVQALRRVRDVRALLPMAPALIASAMAITPAFIALAAAIEMLYHQQLHAAQGTALHFGGLVLDTASPASWVTCLAVAVGGLPLAIVSFRRLRMKWEGVQTAKVAPATQSENATAGRM